MHITLQKDYTLRLTIIYVHTFPKAHASCFSRILPRMNNYISACLEISRRDSNLLIGLLKALKEIWIFNESLSGLLTSYLSLVFRNATTMFHLFSFTLLIH